MSVWMFIILSSFSSAIGAEFLLVEKKSNNTVLLNVKKMYQIGSLLISLFEEPAETDPKIVSQKYGRDVSLNDKVFTSDINASICEDQVTGSSFWGLTRISRRWAPPYQSGDTYSYDSVENGEDINIFIVDSGVDVSHSAFSLSRAVHGMTAADLKSAQGDADLNGHGTHVAGLAGGDPYGVARKANIVAVKVLDRDGSGYIDWILEGLEWITNHQTLPGVINMSLGLIGSNFALESAVSEMVRLGMPVIVAAGNDDILACNASPALSTDAITVGATNYNDRLTSFTNYGSCVDILAPGQAILSSVPGEKQKIYDGTSMAAPLVAGVAATILSHSPHFIPYQVRAVLMKTATEGAISDADNLNTINKLLYSCDTCVECDDNAYVPPIKQMTTTTTPKPWGPEESKGTTLQSMGPFLYIAILVMLIY